EFRPKPGGKEDRGARSAEKWPPGLGQNPHFWQSFSERWCHKKQGSCASGRSPSERGMLARSGSDSRLLGRLLITRFEDMTRKSGNLGRWRHDVMEPYLDQR